jgi:tetratricopeptide (TPR) repeat protein
MAKDMSTVFMMQAKQLFDAGKFSAAIMILQEGLKQYPQFMSARVLLGEVHWTAGEAALARAELEYVINSVPDNFAAHRKLALIYREIGEVQLSMHSCRTVLQANPRDLEMRTLLEQLQDLPAPVSDPPQAAPPIPILMPTVHELPPDSVLRPPHLVMASTPEPVTKAKEPDSIDSETLAELYILQGHQDKGLLVYHRLAAKYPQNKQYRDRIEALERPAAKDLARPSESTSEPSTLPHEALSMEKEVSPTGEKPVSAGLGLAGEMRLPGGLGETGEEVRLGGLRGGLGEMAQRKNQVRRLEGWLQVVRARRRL